MKSCNNDTSSMNIEVFEIASTEDNIYQELLKQYEINAELEEMLDRYVYPVESILMGDLRLITVLDDAVNGDGIKVYLLKDIDTNIFICLIGHILDSGKKAVYPLLKNIPPELWIMIQNCTHKKWPT